MKRIALLSLLLLTTGQTLGVKAQNFSAGMAVEQPYQTFVWPDYKKDWLKIPDVSGFYEEVENKNSDYKRVSAYLLDIGTQEGWTNDLNEMTKVVVELSILGNKAVCRLLSVKVPGFGLKTIATQFKINGQWMDVRSQPRFFPINDYMEDKKVKGVRMVADPIDLKAPPVEVLLENKEDP